MALPLAAIKIIQISPSQPERQQWRDLFIGKLTWPDAPWRSAATANIVII